MTVLVRFTPTNVDDHLQEAATRPLRLFSAAGEATWNIAVIAKNLVPINENNAFQEVEYLGVIEGSEADFGTWNSGKLAVVDEADIGDFADWAPDAWPRAAGADHLARYNAGIADLRRNRFTAIDAKTRQIVAAGFTYNAKTFSLSPEAQSMWHGMHQDRDNLTYPVVVNVLDDTDDESLADAAAVAAFYTAMVTQVRSALGGGTALKSAVRAATTQWDILAVEDSR